MGSRGRGRGRGFGARERGSLPRAPTAVSSSADDTVGVGAEVDMGLDIDGTTEEEGE